MSDKKQHIQDLQHALAALLLNPSMIDTQDNFDKTVAAYIAAIKDYKKG
jgi:hypothetical protein